MELNRTLDVHQRIARVMADKRFPERGPNVRLLTVTVIWVAGIEKPPPGQRWARVRQILNLRPYGLADIISADAPRWEPEPGDGTETCEAPMIRREGLCGQRVSAWPQARVTNPADGTWRMARFCRRHEDYAYRADRADLARVEAGGIPEPVPNTGGLMPCYLTMRDWNGFYAQARSGWTPPSYGICADDWPVLAKVTAMEPPKLRALDGGSEHADGDWSAPSLRLVTQ